MSFFKKQQNNKKMQDGTLHETLNKDSVKENDKKNPQETKGGNDASEANNGEVGPLAGIIIVLIILVGGASYFFVQQVYKPLNTQNKAEENSPIIEELKDWSSSDKIKAIEKDLKETPTENLDKGIEKIKQELKI